MKEISQRITELMNESHQAVEDIVEQAVSEALSTNNAKWRERIKAELSTYRNMIKQYPDAPIGSMAEEVIKTLESLLSQMEVE